MYFGSDEFNSAIENTHGNAPKTRLKFADDEILDLVSSIRYYGGPNDSDDVSIGTTTMARVEVSAYTDKLLTGREFLLEQGIELADGTMEYMPIGYFTIQKPSGDIDQVTFTAYDRMQKFEKPYSSNLAYPTTSILILDELCQICGIELATAPDNAIEVTENLKGYTCREVLGYIASMHSSFACIDRYGRLNLRWYSDTPIEKSLKKIWHFEKSQDNFEIAKVEIAKDSETNYVSGDGITTLHNSNPLATQEITDGIFAKLGGFSYSVGEIEMLDDARLDPWDMISVEYYDGKTYKIPCMSLEHDFKAYSTTVKSVGKSESENEYRFTGPTIQYLNRMAADLLVANRVIATKVDADYVNSVAITTENFDAKVAEIKELIVEEIDGKYANIDLANIDIANINVGKIGELFAKVGLIDRATIVEGHITGFLDAVEVNANKITAGTLVADRILLSGGKEGVLYALNNLGELTSTNVDTLDGYILTDRTITADKIIAKSITTNELDVDKIFGNEAVLNKIVSQDIFSNAVATNRIVVGKANKDDVVVDNLFPYPYQKYYNLQGNVEWFVDEDGIVTTSGTSNAASALYISTDFTLEPGTYTVSGCPSGGNSSTYRIQMANSDWSVHINDFGDGVTFTLTEKTTFTTIRCYIASGVNTNGLVFKPMLVKGTEIFPFYPHRLSTQGLIEQMKVDNLFDVNLRCSKTINGVTGTVKENGNALLNGTISANGTAMTANTSTYINISDLEIGESITISVRILSGTYNQATSSTASFYFDVRTADGTNLTDAAIKGGTVLHLTNHYGKVTYTMTQERKNAGAYYIYPQIWAHKNDVFDNLEMQVMIEKGDIAHWYTEYSKGGTGIANNLYREGTTLIDGNKIYTSSILADSIDIDDLFADTAFIDALRTNSIIVGIGNKADTALSEVNKTVKSITMHYLATTASSGVTTSTSGWTTTVQQIDATKKYLWTYQTITYVDNTTTNTSPVISGVYGNEGVDGKGITSVTPLYYLKSNTTAPSAPTSAVTSTSTSSGVWSKSVPTYVANYTYFTCTQTQYTNGTYGWSTVVADNALTNANKTANTANSTATTANNTANATKKTLASLTTTDNNVTVIDGGKIKTGSITADKIDVDDLFAEDITATGSITGVTLISGTSDDRYRVVVQGGAIEFQAFDTRGEGDWKVTGSLYTSSAGSVDGEGYWTFEGLATLAGNDVDDMASDLTSHIGNKSNPHKVTKKQVGLGNCDNTSDANKPISTATQTALDNITDIINANYIQTGNILNSSIGDCEPDTITSLNVTFNKAYNVTPKVFTQIMTESSDVGYGNMLVTVGNVSKTGCTIKINNKHAGTLAPNILWVAIGKMA